MDKIRIDSLVCYGHVGVPLAERRQRQRILIDVELLLNLKGAGATDQVRHTLDYSAVASEVKQTVAGRSFRLVEAVAESAAQRILKRFRPEQVMIRVRKFSVPGVSSVGVEIRRYRGE